MQPKSPTSTLFLPSPGRFSERRLGEKALGLEPGPKAHRARCKSKVVRKSTKPAGMCVRVVLLRIGKAPVLLGVRLTNSAAKNAKGSPSLHVKDHEKALLRRCTPRPRLWESNVSSRLSSQTLQTMWRWFTCQQRRFSDDKVVEVEPLF